MSSDSSPARDHRFFPQSFKGQSGVFGSTLIDLSNPEEISRPEKKGYLPVSVPVLYEKHPSRGTTRHPDVLKLPRSTKLGYLSISELDGSHRAVPVSFSSSHSK